MGSAANALIDRLPRNESWVSGRSHCDKCKHVLNWYDLLPVFSYLLVKGKCRYCKSPIPPRNLLVEMFLGLAFIVLSWKFSVVSGQTILLFGILWVTTIIAVMDWETKLVSEAIVITWAVLVLMSVGLSLSPLVGVVTGVGIIGGIWAATKGKAMGFGDVEIAAVMGYWLGWQNTLVGLWLAFVTGAIVGVYQIIKGKKKLKSEIAFGPFLVIGAWMAYFWGDTIIRWMGFPY